MSKFLPFHLFTRPHNLLQTGVQHWHKPHTHVASASCRRMSAQQARARKCRDLKNGIKISVISCEKIMAFSVLKFPHFLDMKRRRQSSELAARAVLTVANSANIVRCTTGGAGAWHGAGVKCGSHDASFGQFNCETAGFAHSRLLWSQRTSNLTRATPTDTSMRRLPPRSGPRNALR